MNHVNMYLFFFTFPFSPAIGQKSCSLFAYDQVRQSRAVSADGAMVPCVMFPSMYDMKCTDSTHR